MAEQAKEETKDNGAFDPQPQFEVKAVAKNCINQTAAINEYCMGYGFGTTATQYGYIAVPKLSVALVDTKDLDQGTANIVSYDKTEKLDAYIGQINMLTASSFCGLNGLLWGYHLCKNLPAKEEPLFVYPGPNYPPGEKLPEQGTVPVYPIGPLLDAGIKLFGRMDILSGQSKPQDRRRFPPLPGSMVVCANKSVGLYGPGYVWSIIGCAIAKNRERDSNLFIEDANAIQAIGTDDTQIQLDEQSVKDELKARLLNIAKSMVLCGQDQNVVYSKIYMGAKYLKVEKDQYGTALCCAPYVQLPQEAVPKDHDGSYLVDIKLTEWENILSKELGPEKFPDLPDLISKDPEFAQDYQGIGINMRRSPLDIEMFKVDGGGDNDKK